jgi:S-formylglutathione hydrolase FrmB
MNSDDLIPESTTAATLAALDDHTRRTILAIKAERRKHHNDGVADEALARDADPRELPQITFDCGCDDHLLEQNRRFNAFRERRGITHAYHEHPGGHDWDYWDARLPEALAQHVAAFRRG